MLSDIGLNLRGLWRMGDDRDDLLRDGIPTSSPTAMPRTMMAKPALFRTFRTFRTAHALLRYTCRLSPI
jgi:hypothetical protein